MASLRLPTRSVTLPATGLHASEHKLVTPLTTPASATVAPSDMVKPTTTGPVTMKHAM